jgi:uncharacterized repeat protein (TIGR03803 family)
MTSKRNLEIRVLSALRAVLTLAVFSALLLIPARPAQAQTETVLYKFTGGSDGGWPGRGVIADGAGNLYGTTQGGGASGQGIVFELSPNGSGGWNETVLYNFCSRPNCSDGGAWNSQLPSNLIFDSSGNLYGTTPGGGAYGYGVVYELSLVGGSWTETVLHSFAGGADGANPTAGVIIDPAGNLYGTTGWNGSSVSGGTVFQLSPSGGGGTEQVIYADGYVGFGGLVMNAAGNIFGPAINNYTGEGLVFELSPNGSGGWTSAVIYNFPCTHTSCPIGADPDSALVFDKAGNLYGTALYGGSKNYGTVYKLSPGSGTWTGVVLHSFTGGPKDGSHPWGIVFDALGNLYGATQLGGQYGGSVGYGTVFELVGAYQEKVLWSFNATDGLWPFDSLILDSAGNLYGTTYGGGSAGVVFEVVRGVAATATTLVSSLNPSIYGQTVTFTAHVTSNSDTPTGTVNLLDGSTQVGSGTLTNGSVSIPISSLPVGANSITAAYQGGAGFASSTSAPLIQTVNLVTTATTLTSSVNPAVTTQLVTFTATVSSQFGGAATGSVTFFSGSQPLGTASLSGNRAILPTSFATAGTYSISAKYNGDGNNAVSTSPTLSQVILAATTTTLTSSLNPSLVGQAVTFTATVSSTAGTPPNGEIITFNNGSAILGTAPLSGGTASFPTSSLLAGIYTITATYNGDANFAASTSPGLRQVVNSTTKSATATTLVPSLNPSIYGQKVIWTATVTTSGSVPPTGTVNFTWEGNSIGGAALNSSGVATLTKSLLNADSYPLTAVYEGDAKNLGSTSPALNQVIQQATSAATLTSSPNPSTQGQAVTFTATITSPTVTPSGPVTFAAGKKVLGTVELSKGKATFTTSTLAVGSTTVTVTYSWNSNVAESSASVTQTVQP